MKVDLKHVVEEKIIVRHYRTEKHGGVTVCGRYGEHNTLEIGVAFCSPEETHFDKQKGKAIALGRMRVGRNRGYGWSPVDGPLNEVIWKLLRMMVDPPNADKVTDKKVKSARWFGDFLAEMERLRREKAAKESRVAE